MALFHPEADITGARGALDLEHGSTPCAPPHLPAEHARCSVTR